MTVLRDGFLSRVLRNFIEGHLFGLVFWTITNPTGVALSFRQRGRRRMLGSCGMIGGDGINDESSKRSPALYFWSDYVLIIRWTLKKIYKNDTPLVGCFLVVLVVLVVVCGGCGGFSRCFRHAGGC